MKSMVTISRHWKNPEITTVITAENISLSISLDDFMSALKSEVGSVTWTFRDKTFEAQFDDAVKQVLKKVKQESRKVVSA